MGGVELVDFVVGELAELGDAQPGAGQHLDDESSLRAELQDWIDRARNQESEFFASAATRRGG